MNKLEEKLGFKKGDEVLGAIEAMTIGHKFGFGPDEISSFNVDRIEFDEENDIYKLFPSNLEDIEHFFKDEILEELKKTPEELFIPINADLIGLVRSKRVDKLSDNYELEAGMIDTEMYTVPVKLVKSLASFVETLEANKEEWDEVLDEYNGIAIKLEDDVEIPLSELKELIKSSDLE